MSDRQLILGRIGEIAGSFFSVIGGVITGIYTDIVSLI